MQFEIFFYNILYFNFILHAYDTSLLLPLSDFFNAFSIFFQLIPLPIFHICCNFTYAAKKLLHFISEKKEAYYIFILFKIHKINIYNNFRNFERNGRILATYPYMNIFNHFLRHCNKRVLGRTESFY